MTTMTKRKVLEGEMFSALDPNVHVALGTGSYGDLLWVHPATCSPDSDMQYPLQLRARSFPHTGIGLSGNAAAVRSRREFPYSVFSCIVHPDRSLHVTCCLWHKFTKGHVRALDQHVQRQQDSSDLDMGEVTDTEERCLYECETVLHVTGSIWKDSQKRFWYSRVFQININSLDHCLRCRKRNSVVNFQGSQNCVRCGTIHYSCCDCDELTLSDRCEGCQMEYEDQQEENLRERSDLYDYGYKPCLRFFGKKSVHPKLFFGHEVEMVSRKSGAIKALHTMPEVYCKYDGSLSSNGLEVVTHPMTYEYSLEMIHKICTIAREYNSQGYNANCSCGHHIHTPTQAWSDYAIHRALQAMAIPEWRDTMVFISQRDQEHLMRWSAPMSVSKRIATGIAVHKNGADTLGRYVAINVTLNTVEFRLFRSNINPVRLIKNLQFVLITHHIAHSLLPFTRENMIAMAKQHGYSELLAFCRSRQKTLENTRLDLSSPSDTDI